MFRQMRRKDRMLGEAETQKILLEGEYGVLCMQGDYPYAIPVSYVYMDNAIYIHCAASGLKLDLIRKCDKVCFTVSMDITTIPDKLTMHYKSAVLFGRASFSEAEEKKQALIAFAGKYSMEFMDYAMNSIEKHFDRTVIIKIAIEHLSGKQSC